MAYLTKSDFKAGQNCPTSLYYAKRGYPSINDDNPYLEFLADGGYMVETMAKLLFPEGQSAERSGDPQIDSARTVRAVETGDCTLFEATVTHGNLLVRVDVLRRVGKQLHVIEVKASSVHSIEDGANPFRGARGGIKSDWREYIEDVAFQTIVLSRAFPSYEIVPHLYLVDKAKTATANNTFDKFRLRGKDHCLPQVEYLGDVTQLRQEHLLASYCVSDVVAEIRQEVSAALDRFAATITEAGIIKIAPEIGRKCKKCEYRIDEAERNGFAECWQEHAFVNPHILDLYRIDLVGGKKRDAVADFVTAGNSLLTEVPLEMLSGKTGERQKIQIEATARNQEYVSQKLRSILQSLPGPHHFIDFEGSRLAIPFSPRMRPYEQALFQWSCHTVAAPDGEITHSEWLNCDEPFPNFEFARQLKNQLGREGTVYIWSPYELVAFRDIRQQMEKYGFDDADLALWLEEMGAEDNPRIVDLCELVKEHYFHPMMGGQTSIKKVLPAVWTTNGQVREHELFRKYVRYDAAGNLMSPYTALPPLPIAAKEEVVKEGTGAMRVYQEMMFGRSRNDPAIRQAYRQLLLQYCELDTAAMVAVWMHWLSLEP
ncbi:MAG: DUF2779 domain-containing protein [Limisphaerales bacterium]